jgi:hypothetical protein
MTNKTQPKLILPRDFDERAESEAYMKGYLSVSVQLEKGEIFNVYFIDPVRLKQDLDAEIEMGRPFIAQSGLIVVPEITIPEIKKILSEVASEGFFERFKPVT